MGLRRTQESSKSHLWYHHNHSRINPPPARRSAAPASLSIRVIGLAVIEQQFLSRFDVPQREEEDVAVDDPAVAVGFAGVIDELRAVAAAAPVNRPIKVNAAYI
jgi:hypothetical protein